MRKFNTILHDWSMKWTQKHYTIYTKYIVQWNIGIWNIGCQITWAWHHKYIKHFKLHSRLSIQHCGRTWITLRYAKLKSWQCLHKFVMITFIDNVFYVSNISKIKGSSLIILPKYFCSDVQFFQFWNKNYLRELLIIYIYTWELG